MDKNGTSNEAFWALADKRAALEQELKALTRANGAPLGLSFGGWKSPKRRRAQAIAAELRDTDERFQSAQRGFAQAMRDRASEALNEMSTMQAHASSSSRPKFDGWNEFAGARARAAGSLSESAALERMMLRRLMKASPRFGG